MLKSKFWLLALCFALFSVTLPHLHPTISVARATLAPGDNLRIEGIPPIPMSLVTQADRYTQFRTATLQSWHPTRREMLISTRFGDTTQTHRVSQPLGLRYQLTFFDERVSGVSYQPTDGDYFLFSKDIGGTEANQTFRYDVANGDVTLLTDGTSRNGRGVWSTAGDRIVYTSTRRNGADADLYIMDPLEPDNNRLLAEVSGGGWFPTDWSPDDQHIAVIEYISINEANLWLLDVATGEWTPLTQQLGDVPVAYLDGIFSPDGRRLYTVSDRDSEFLHLGYIDLDTQEVRHLTDDIPWNVEATELSPDGTEMAVIINENGASVLYLMDPVTGERRTFETIPAGRLRGLAWHNSGKELGFTLYSARSTADVFSLNLATGDLERWTRSETAGLNTEVFAEPELVAWESFDGHTITGFLYRPPEDKFPGPRPVAMYIHGGPEGQFRPSYLGRLNYYINELGIAMLFPNVRGSTGYGKTFTKLDNGYQREDAVKDIGTLLDWIDAEPGLDGDRVLVSGVSYGGYMSLAVATNYGDRIRASINVVGISNFVTFLENTEDYRRDLRRVEYGDERDPEMRQFLTEISPLTNADNIQKPMLVVHGANDPRVPLSEAEQLVDILAGKDIPVWYLVANDEGHGFSKKQNIDYQFYTNVLFMQQFLLDEPLPGESA
ncbi:MAG: S9 family peptidase [Cyanobacteria bacterium P01_D01_bin.6]